MTFCVAESEAAVEIISCGDIFVITPGADMVELLVLSRAVEFKGTPPRTVGVDVIVGINVTATINDEDLVRFGVGFDGSAVWNLLRAVSTSAFLKLALLAVSACKEVSWARRLDRRRVIVDCMVSASPATILETI